MAEAAYDLEYSEACKKVSSSLLPKQRQGRLTSLRGDRMSRKEERKLTRSEDYSYRMTYGKSRTQTGSRQRTASVGRQKTAAMTMSRSRERQEERRAAATLKKRILCFLMLVVGVGLLIISLLRYNELSVAQKEMNDLTNEVSSLKAERNVLKMEIAPYMDRERLESLASSRLHMVYPDDKQVLACNQDAGSLFEGKQTKLADKNGGSGY